MLVRQHPTLHEETRRDCARLDTETMIESTLTKIEEHGITILPAFGGVMEKGRLITAKKYLAAKFGIAIAKGTTVKTIKAAVNDDAGFKLARKEYDQNCKEFYRASNLANGVLAADPTLRKSVRVAVNKDGQPTGRFVTTYAPITGAIGGPSLRETQLEKENAALRAEYAALAAKATA